MTYDPSSGMSRSNDDGWYNDECGESGGYENREYGNEEGGNRESGIFTVIAFFIISIPILLFLSLILYGISHRDIGTILLFWRIIVLSFIGLLVIVFIFEKFKKMKNEKHK